MASNGLPQIFGSGEVTDYIVTEVLNCDPGSSVSTSTKHISLPVSVVWEIIATRKKLC